MATGNCATQGFTEPLQSQTFIHRLNEDVLCSVFTLVAEDDIPRGPLVKVSGELGWIKVTHVCRYWRLVGIGHAILWGRVLCVFPTAFDAVFSRISPESPLRIRITFDQGNTLASADRRLDLIKKRPNRLETLDIHGNYNSLAALSGREYVQLQSLVLKQRYSYYRPPFFHNDSPIIAPILTRLSLDGYHMPFVAPLLKSLNITGSAGQGWALTISHALDVLEHCPLLQILTLSDIFHGREIILSEQAACSGRTVHLKYLHTSNITASSEAFAALWSHVSASSLTYLSITCYDSISYGHPSSSFNIISVIRPMIVLADQLQLDEYDHEAFSGGLTLSSSHSPMSCSITLCTPIRHYLHEFVHLCTHVAAALLDGQIRFFTAGRMLLFTGLDLRRALSSVSSLSVTLHRMPDFTTRNTDELSFRTLQLLTIDVRYSAYDYGHQKMMPATLPAFQAAWTSLVEFAKDRARMGFPITTLKLIGPSGGSIASEELRAAEIIGIEEARQHVGEIVDERVNNI